MEREQDRKLVKVLLRGEYEPADFFDDAYVQTTSHVEVRFSDGTVEASFLKNDLVPTLDEMNLARLQVGLIFKGRQLQTRRAYRSKGLSLVEQFDNGERNVYVEAESSFNITATISAKGTFTSSTSTAEIDQEAIRKGEERKFMEKLVRHGRDELLGRLMGSYEHALNDSPNMVIYIYEIRDALKTAFNNDQKARNELGISQKAWSNLGQLANNEPIAEGRHRGNHPKLRPATENERKLAFEFGTVVIDAYLDWLDRNL
jgi:hypothetical protein